MKASFGDSLILTTQAYRQLVMKFLCEYNLKAKVTRIYRGSQHTFASASFHSYCDGKGPTITIIRTTNNRIFGGFTAATWESDSWKNDPAAFIFSLDLQQKYPVVTTAHAIRCHSSYGPTFGGGFDLLVSNNSNANKESYLNSSSYNLPKQGSYTALNNGEREFQTSEIEVYQVTCV